MTINYPGPYQVRVFYTTNNGDHVLALNTGIDGTPAPATPFDEINPLDASGVSAATLDVFIDSLIALLQPLWPEEGDFTHAELWKYTANSFDAEYVSTYAINAVGSSLGTIFPASQEIYTFRSTNGGVMKVTLMETIDVPGVSESYGFLSAARQDLVDWFLLAGNCFIARDNGFPFAFLKMHPGQNERLFKKIYRE